MTTSTLPTTLQTRAQVLADNEERRAFGKQHMSAAMIWWLARNDWSHPNMEILASWALHEEGALHTSQISHIRNGRLRMLGVKTIDALGAINLAVWAYHQDKKALKLLGCSVVDAKIEKLIKDATPLLHPTTGEPLDAGGFMNLYLGYLTLEGVVGGASSITDFSAIADKIGGYLENAIRTSGTDFVDAKGIFAKAFGGDMAKATKLVACAAGLDKFTADELTADAASICNALERLDGKERTPDSLIKDLA